MDIYKAATIVGLGLLLCMVGYQWGKKEAMFRLASLAKRVEDALASAEAFQEQLEQEAAREKAGGLPEMFVKAGEVTVPIEGELVEATLTLTVLEPGDKLSRITYPLYPPAEKDGFPP